MFLLSISKCFEALHVFIFYKLDQKSFKMSRLHGHLVTCHSFAMNTRQEFLNLTLCENRSDLFFNTIIVPLIFLGLKLKTCSVRTTSHLSVHTVLPALLRHRYHQVKISISTHRERSGTAIIKLKISISTHRERSGTAIIK